MAELNTTISAVVISITRLKTSIKIQRFSNWIKNITQLWAVYETYFKYMNTDRLKVNI